MANLDSFKALSNLKVNGKNYRYYNIAKAAKEAGIDFQKLPRSLKVLLENLVRNEDGSIVTKQDIEALAQWQKTKTSNHEIAYYPARVLMQDFTGVPAVVDLAAMRDAMKNLGGDPQVINPLNPVDLVIDHSVSVDHFGSEKSFQENVQLEFQRNNERYEFLKWGQKAFKNFRVVPPGTGICHQVNLEYLAKVVWTKESGGETLAYCDTLVGTDSHTTMINGLAVLGWGVGGIEAEAAMLGQAVTMLIPEVVGFKLEGALKEGTTATDLVLTVVEMLRKKGVVGKFVEFYGSGIKNLSLADRATIANMAPEYGATCGFFPIDDETLNYLSFTGREQQQVDLVKAYAQEQGLWIDQHEPDFSDSLHLDMSTVEASLAGPKRPQDRVDLKNVSQQFKADLENAFAEKEPNKSVRVENADFELKHGHVCIAAITSCTNTSNPSVLIAAGLVAKKANAKGLKVKPWVKTSLAPGSQVVTDYLIKANLQQELDQLGFNLVGYGCTTCIGNSGGVPENISKAINEGNLVACSVLSGNRNFEGRIGQDIRANFLASPPLVVAYALAGSMNVNITSDSLGTDLNGNDVFLKDVWPTNQEIKEVMNASLSREMFVKRYANVFDGGQEWQDIKVAASETYAWDGKSTYVQNPPYFEKMTSHASSLQPIKKANILAILGDSVTTDHISPAGAIKADSPAGQYLQEHQVKFFDFNSYGSRRGNHQVMMRGTFANIRIKNEMLDGIEGGFTKHIPSGETLSIYDAAMKYQQTHTPLVIFAGKEYGTGSSRDWAAKGTLLLGVKAVIAESFERIHRSNLIGMGVIPLEFTNNQNRKTFALNGSETIELLGINDSMVPQATIKALITYGDGKTQEVSLRSRIDTGNELEYFKNGGILHYVLRRLNA